MALLHTPEKYNSFKALDFSLPGTDGKVHTLDSCRGERGLLVMFICNHCPYVKAIIDRLVADCRALQESGVGCVAIMPNDTAEYPDDSFDNMKKFSAAHGFSFPYLIDESQKTARAYGAVCTPDFFGFNADGMLAYRGRIDAAGKNAPAPDTKRELRDAMMHVARTGQGPAQQFPSMGCSIKWKQGG